VILLLFSGICRLADTKLYSYPKNEANPARMVKPEIASVADCNGRLICAADLTVVVDGIEVAFWASTTVMTTAIIRRANVSLLLKRCILQSGVMLPASINTWRRLKFVYLDPERPGKHRLCKQFPIHGHFLF